MGETISNVISFLAIVCLIFISGCIENKPQDPFESITEGIPLTNSGSPSWAPTYVPSNWKLPNVQKATDYEYFLTYEDIQKNKIALAIDDNTGFPREKICQTLSLKCIDVNGVLVSEYYDKTKGLWVQDALTERYMASYYAKNKLATDELIKMVKSMD